MQDNTRKHILVTGANGFVGKELIKILTGSYRVTACIRTISSQEDIKSFLVKNNINFENNLQFLFVTDNNIEHDVQEVLSSVDAVVHCAARSHILKEESSNPEHEFNKSNNLLTQSLIRAAVNAKVKRFIYISSINVNGNNSYSSPFDERSIPKPISLYAQSKLRAEEQVKKYSSLIQTVIIRPPLVIGPDSKGNLARLIKAVMRKLPLPLASINNKRQYIGVRNLSFFIQKCIESDNAVDKIFLVANEEVLSTAELIKEIAACLGTRAYLLPFSQKVLYLILKLLGKEKEYYQIAGDMLINSDYANKALAWKNPYTLRQEIEYSLGNKN